MSSESRVGVGRQRSASHYEIEQVRKRASAASQLDRVCVVQNRHSMVVVIIGMHQQASATCPENYTAVVVADNL